MKRGELAKRTGCNIETIRYYENVGILPEPPRTGAGHRVYDEVHATQLRFVIRARELGFSIEDIRGLLGLGTDKRLTCAVVKERTERHLADVRTKISDLKRIEAVLAETASKCSGDDVPECPVLNTLSL